MTKLMLHIVELKHIQSARRQHLVRDVGESANQYNLTIDYY